MLSSKFFYLFVAIVLLGTTGTARAWDQKENDEKAAGRLDVALSYEAMYSNPVGGGSNFWLQGGGVQTHDRFWRGLGVVADISGAHDANVNSSGVGLDIVTATFGPRYTLRVHRKPISVYGQALTGEAFGINSLFPGIRGSSDSADSFALELGGGVNYNFRWRLSLRALEADWVRTKLPNASTNVQNNLRIGAGFVLHIK